MWYCELCKWLFSWHRCLLQNWKELLKDGWQKTQTYFSLLKKTFWQTDRQHPEYMWHMHESILQCMTIYSSLYCIVLERYTELHSNLIPWIIFFKCADFKPPYMTQCCSSAVLSYCPTFNRGAGWGGGVICNMVDFYQGVLGSLYCCEVFFSNLLFTSFSPISFFITANL